MSLETRGIDSDTLQEERTQVKSRPVHLTPRDILLQVEAVARMSTVNTRGRSSQIPIWQIAPVLIVLESRVYSPSFPHVCRFGGE